MEELKTACIDSSGFQVVLVVKNPPASAGNAGDLGLIPGLGRSWSKKWHPTPIFLPGEFHGQKNLAGYSPWSCKELDKTERLTLSFIG